MKKDFSKYRRRPAFWFMLVTSCLMLEVMAGCSKGGDNSDGRDRDPAVNAGMGEGPRPIEDSENLLGYLTNPKLVSVRHGDRQDEFVITGEAGAVGRLEDDAGIDMVFWRIDRADLKSASSSEQGKLLAAQALQTSAVNSDGSFTYILTAGFRSGFVLGISVEGKHDDDTVLVRENGDLPTVGYIDPGKLEDDGVELTPLFSDDL